jgi:carbamate kinase
MLVVLALGGNALLRVVPSPRPQPIFEIKVIDMLVKSGVIVICAGGGGIPTVYRPGRILEGVEAVIDKDRAGALLATIAVGAGGGAYRLRSLVSLRLAITPDHTGGNYALTQSGCLRVRKVMS